MSAPSIRLDHWRDLDAGVKNSRYTPRQHAAAAERAQNGCMRANLGRRAWRNPREIDALAVRDGGRPGELRALKRADGGALNALFQR